MSRSPVDIWDRVIRPSWGRLAPPMARAVLKLKFNKADLQRVRKLSGKAQEGTLTPAERSELEQYIQIGRTLAIMHSQARRSLKAAGDSPTPRRKAS